MTYKVCYWDAETQSQQERDATPDESAEIESRRSSIPTPREISDAMMELFDKTAQSKHYDNRITCALRAGYPGPFHDEGAAFATWMDACNATAYTMLAEVQAGTKPMPTSTAEALALLPAIIW